VDEPCGGKWLARSYFHGTHVAGIIGAVGNNNEGVVGVCWDVSLMSLKVFADDSNVAPEVFVSDAIAAIEYAVENGADIINASWGGFSYSEALRSAIRDAGKAGVVFVAAAGNYEYNWIDDNYNNNDFYPVYPASYEEDNIISVLATDRYDQVSYYSRYGPSTVDVGEPGESIWSTFPTYDTPAMQMFYFSQDYDSVYGYEYAYYYEILNGTSMAAPYASGACALIMSHYPWIPGRVAKNLLMDTVDVVLPPGYCRTNGRVNVYNALMAVPQGKPGRVLNATRGDPNDANNIYSSIQAAIDDANGGDDLVAEANSLFVENVDFRGMEVTLRSGDINNPSDMNVSPENTYILGVVIDGPAVSFSSGEGPGTVLKGFTISWGGGDYGGGIACNGSSPTISNCIIKDNVARFYGGGIDCYNSSPDINDCIITGNRTSRSAGIGGGINCEGGSATIRNCTISYNSVENVGGGIACYNTSPDIYNCLLANNSAGYSSGGIDLDNSSPEITNCTIVVDDFNVPATGGISAYLGSAPVIKNCILWGNGDDLSNCSATYSCIEDGDSGEGNTGLYPFFVTGPSGDYYLSQVLAGQPWLGSRSIVLV